MLFMVDAGNTSIKLACYDDSVRRIGQLMTRQHRSRDEYGLLIEEFLSKKGFEKPDSAIISSVVPSLTKPLTDALRKSFKVDTLIVTYRIETGLTFSVKKPQQIGADRIVNAAAAHKLYHGTLIVIDCGSATTFCGITEEGQYLGGPIMPGPGMMTRALTDNTAALPLIELNMPTGIIGSNTEENILSGIVFGHAGAIEKIVSHLKTKLDSPIKVIATGGLISFVAPLVNSIDELDTNLTFKGLHLLYEMNKNIANKG
jgi:type III pantothenate kinase